MLGVHSGSKCPKIGSGWGFDLII